MIECSDNEKISENSWEAAETHGKLQKKDNKTTTMENEKHEAWNQPQPPQPQYRPDNKKVAAGILAILLGVFGIHKFILGYIS